MTSPLFFYTFWRATYLRTYRPVAFRMMMYHFDKLSKGQLCEP